MAKRIKLTAAIAVEFNQRAAGQETPYWVGTIWDVSGRKAVAIGDFENSGTGGPTSVRLFANAPDRDAIDDMGKAAFSDLGVDAFEADGAVIAWAEMIGYGLKCDREEFTLQDYVDMFWGDGSGLSPRTDAQESRGAAAKAKADRIDQVAAAKRAAKRGQTVVKIGDEYYTFKTRDEGAIRRSAAAKFAGREVEILA